MRIKANEKNLKLHVSRLFEGKRQISFAATHHEIVHGREISWAMRAKEAPEHIKADWPGSAWVVELLTSCSRDDRSFKARHLFITSLRTTQPPHLPAKLTPLHFDHQGVLMEESNASLQ